jgi:hypothetical protein
MLAGSARAGAARAGSVLVASVVVAGFIQGLGSLPAAGADQSSSPSGPTSAATCTTLHFVVSSPRPGDMLTPGNYVVQGFATDTAASSGPGVDRVQIFWDQPRESGGLFLGGIDLSQPASSAGATSSQATAAANQALAANGAFSVVALIPKQIPTSSESGTHTVFAYARSALSGQEQTISFMVQLTKPINVGAYTPTPTPVPAVVSPPPCAPPTPTPTFPPFPAPPAEAVTVQTLVLDVYNPKPNAVLGKGLYTIQGLAYDSSAQASSGVDRVDVYLDPRDTAGAFLGTATLGGSGGTSPFGFSLLALLPDAVGGHNLTVYARSAVSGRETSLTIPIVLQ